MYLLTDCKYRNLMIQFNRARGYGMDEKQKLIEKTRKNIQKIRKNSPDILTKEHQIALGKVIFELKNAKVGNSDIMKKLFSL